MIRRIADVSESAFFIFHSLIFPLSGIMLIAVLFFPKDTPDQLYFNHHTQTGGKP